MNILVFAHDAYLYGASQSLLTVLKGLIKKKDRNLLVLLPSNGIFEKELVEAKINYKIIPFPRCVDFNYSTVSPIIKLKFQVSYYIKHFLILKRLIKIANEFKTDVIYTNTSVVYVGYKIAKILNVPHVWHIREFGDLDFNLKYYPSKIKIQDAVNNSEKSIFASIALKNHWVSRPSSCQFVVYNGIMDAKFNDKISFRKFPKINFKIGLLGSVLQGKGHHIAIKAFAGLVRKISKCELYFFGHADNVYSKDLKKLIKELQLEDKIHFKPFINDKHLIYKELDLVINCSKMEGFGRTIVEAMGYGIPVIANASGGVLEIIDNKINGLLFDGTSESLTNALVTLLTDNNLYENLAYNGMKRAEWFSVENYISAIDKILFEASNDSKACYKKINK
jgi:L-malate glycosyltransferase